MQVALDPYTPGAGRTPVELVGRDAQLQAADVLVTRAARHLPPARPLLLTGLRGTGKTVLLNEVTRRLEADSWLTVATEAAHGRGGAAQVRHSLAAGLARAALSLDPDPGERVRRLLATITSFSLTLGLTSLSLGVERDPQRASTGSLETDLRDVAADVAPLLAERGVALAVVVDEMQDLDDELLGALVSVQHQAAQQGWNLYVLGAGLPGLPGRLASTRSYAERMYEVHAVGPLEPGEARRVLTEPAARMGARYDPDALDLLVEVSGCYPYFLQELGSATWAVAQGPHLTALDARAGVELGWERLDSMFFAARWDRATSGERAYLEAMSRDGDGGSSVSQVSDRLGKTPGSLGPTRANLIAKGLVYAPERGRIAFTVPGFARYVGRRTDVGD